VVFHSRDGEYVEVAIDELVRAIGFMPDERGAAGARSARSPTTPLFSEKAVFPSGDVDFSSEKDEFSRFLL
jgi:hypothetical protein